jgi:hypothetical protein
MDTMDTMDTDGFLDHFVPFVPVVPFVPFVFFVFFVVSLAVRSRIQNIVSSAIASWLSGADLIDGRAPRDS